VSSWEPSSYYGRREPLLYIGSYGLDLTSLLVVIQICATILAAIAFASGHGEACYRLFMFRTDTFWSGYFWTPVTDPFFHDIVAENIWFVIGLFFFWRFGRDLEQYLGRTSFGTLYGLLVLVPVVAVLIASLFLHSPMTVRLPGGDTPVNYAVFISFCAVYPGLMFWCIIEARWAALISMALVLAVILASQSWVMLIPFLSAIATAFLYLSYCGANRLCNPFEWLENWKQDRALRTFEARQKLFLEEEEDFNDAVNPILDKIAREGIQSLTPQEKQKLERARAQLLKRERPNRR